MALHRFTDWTGLDYERLTKSNDQHDGYTHVGDWGYTRGVKRTFLMIWNYEPMSHEHSCEIDTKERSAQIDGT